MANLFLMRPASANGQEKAVAFESATLAGGLSPFRGREAAGGAALTREASGANSR
jgi:hypothetical protein